MKKFLTAILILVLLGGIASGVFFFAWGGCDNGGNDVDDGIAYVPTVSATPTYGGEIVLAMSSPANWCPLSAQSESHIQFFGLIFDSLVNVQPNMVPAPNLATSWEVSENGRVWTLQLNPNARWHDGEPFTSQDVVFTVNSIRARRHASIFYPNIQNISRVNAVDEHTVEFTLSSPRSNFVNLLYFPIIKHQSAAHNPTNYTPLGTGAFVFTSRAGDSLTLPRNSYWHRGNPYVDAVRVVVADTNQSTFLFSAGQIDMLIDHEIIWGRAVNIVDVRHMNIPTNRFTFLGFNHRNQALQEVAVRQAIAHSINFEAIAQNVLHNRAVASFTPINPSWQLHDSSAELPEFDSELARQILIDDGWELDGDVFTKWVRGARRRLQFDLLVNNDNPVREQVAAIIARNLREAGIVVNIVSVPFDQYSSRISWGGFDLVLGEFNILADLNFDFMLRSYNNPFNLRDNELNRILTDTQAATTPADTAIAFVELQRYMRENVPIIGLYFKQSVLMYSPRLGGAPTPLFHNVFNGIENLWAIEGLRVAEPYYEDEPLIYVYYD